MVAATGTDKGKLMLFIMELWKENYICCKALNFGIKENFALHSIITADKAIYASDSLNNKLYKYNICTNEISETNVGSNPRHICLDKENIYVANFESDDISIVDLDSFTLTGSIPAGIKAHDVIYSKKLNSLYTTCYEENQVLEYNIQTGKSRTFTTNGKPMHLFQLNNHIVVMTYFVNGNINTNINFINLNDGKIEDIIILNGLASDFKLDCAKNMLYIINIEDKSLYVVNASLRKIVKKVYLGGYPESVAFSEKNIYVTNSKKQTITVIDKTEYSIIRSVELGFVPDLISVIDIRC